MRVGTWNLAGRQGPDHLAFLAAPACDVWLLTEVPAGLALPGFAARFTSGVMVPGRHWAGVLTRDKATPLPDPHPASAAVTVGDATFCASVLPWRTCGDGPPWRGTRHGEKTQAVVGELDGALPEGDLVWGGDWNTALTGVDRAGSLVGKAAIAVVVARRRLQVPTADLPSRSHGHAAIDHIAVPEVAAVTSARRLSAGGLSDHDAYVVDLAWP